MTDPAATVGSMPQVIELLPDDTTPSTRLEEPAAIFGDPSRRLVRNVNRPTLTVHLPEEGQRSGVGVVVCPGGGWHVLSIDSEGTDVATALNRAGHVAFVLEYRLAPTPVEAEPFQQLFLSLFADLARFRSIAEGLTSALAADGRAALELVAARASDWGVDPARLGLLGFSAGGHLATRLALEPPTVARPAFVASIYGAHFGPATSPDDAPPLFLAFAADDPLVEFVRVGSMELHRAWSEAGQPVELHVYERGNHGFGLRPQGLTSDRWFEQLLAWIEQR